ncbi:MAG: HD-GYP domain-containing protein [Solirubrobacteraceae bacterium]
MPTTSKTARRLYFAASGLLLAGSLSAAVFTSRTEDWHPIGLVVLLGALVLAGELLHVSLRSQTLSGAFIAVVLAASLLGPAPAVAFALPAGIPGSRATRRAARYWVANLSNAAAYALVGGLLVRVLIGDVHNPRNFHMIRGVDFGIIVFGVFMATTAVNFALVAAGGRLMWGRTLTDQVRELLMPMLSVQFMFGLLAAIVAVAYTNLGFAIWPLAIPMLAAFQYLTTRMVRSEDRLEQLIQEAMRRVSMEVGALEFGMRGLEARHRDSGHHAAAVARYAEDLARELGCNAEEQRLAHSAGLLHDIGKGPLPDRVLHAPEIADQADWEALRHHPIEGAAHVGHFPDYREVADVILAHHERWDGSGYPDGLIGPEIPLLARIVAICEAYDAMTALESYGKRHTAEDAFAELRREAGKQFDNDAVESFIAVRTRDGALLIEGADLRAEFDVERRALLQLVDPREPSTLQAALRELKRIWRRRASGPNKQAPVLNSVGQAPHSSTS